MRRWLVVLGLALAAAPAAFGEMPRVADERIVLHTSLGNAVLALYPDVAPNHVAQIERLVRMGVYDGTFVYRIDPSFMVQFSGAHARRLALSPDQAAAIHPLQGEFSALSHRRGVLSMAREDNDPNSAQTSFIILLADAPHLDGRYTIFGHLEGGEDFLQAIVRVARRPDSQPKQPIVVERAEVVASAEALRQMPSPVLNPSTAGWPVGVRRAVFWLSGLVLLSLCGFLAAGRALPPSAGSIGLLGVLAGSFGLFVVLAPHASTSSVMASGLFFGLLGLFKLLSWFERPRLR